MKRILMELSSSLRHKVCFGMPTQRDFTNKIIRCSFGETEHFCERSCRLIDNMSYETICDFLRVGGDVRYNSGRAKAVSLEW